MPAFNCRLQPTLPHRATQPCADCHSMARWAALCPMLALMPRDLDNGVLRIRKGKGGKSRTVALDPEAWAVLQAWLERKARMGIGGPVFSTLHGEPLLSSYVRSLFKRLGRKANIAKRVHPHGLRHTFASSLADEKIDIRIIQRALGHSSLGTTARYVDHLNPTAVIDALRARTW